MSKVAEPPVLPPSVLSDFPSLSGGGKKSEKKKTASVTVPVNSNNKSSTKNAKNLTKNEEASESKTKSKKKKAKGNEKQTTSASANDLERKSDDSEGEKLQNGLIKKRSELKIGNLESPEPDQPNPADFPALPAPPGFPARPPPGFAQQNTTIPNDLTFTNSTGRTYSIRPITKYIQPENFAKRNRDLVEKCMTVLNNGEAIREFKNYSNLFRSGTLPARMFYNHCRFVLGDKFGEVFPELLVLLPDVEKQQELYEVHSAEDSAVELVVCESCSQVVFKKELKDHCSYHDVDFPPLGKSDNANVWKK